ncbi:MAG: hypothetical protein PVJ67_00685 [Candidatus Pacearchaeota archaeon]|jgi:predicted Zn-dependent protease
MVSSLENIPRLNLVRLGKVLSYTTLKEIGERIIDSFDGIIRDIDLSHFETPVTESIDAYFLTRILDTEFGGHTLGITDADLKTKDEDAFYNTIIGGKNPENDVAVVSIRRLSPERIETQSDYELLVQRTLKVSLHEMGHNLGLTDHADYYFGAKGALCPMSKGETNKLGHRAYIRAVVDGRGADFCDECNYFLKTVYGNKIKR